MKVSPATVIATIALIVATTGTSVAAMKIDGSTIRNGSVTTDKLAQRTAYATVSNGKVSLGHSHSGINSAAIVSPTLTCVYLADAVNVDKATIVVSNGQWQVNQEICHETNSILVTTTTYKTFSVMAVMADREVA